MKQATKINSLIAVFFLYSNVNEQRREAIRKLTLVRTHDIPI